MSVRNERPLPIRVEEAKTAKKLEGMSSTAPLVEKLLAVKTDGTTEEVTVGENLTLENGVLKATGQQEPIFITLTQAQKSALEKVYINADAGICIIKNIPNIQNLNLVGCHLQVLDEENLYLDVLISEFDSAGDCHLSAPISDEAPVSSDFNIIIKSA